MVSWKRGCLKQDSFNLNARCLYTISIHHTEKNVVSSYIDDYFYWYTYVDLGKWFLDTLGNRFRVDFMGY